VGAAAVPGVNSSPVLDATLMLECRNYNNTSTWIIWIIHLWTSGSGPHRLPSSIILMRSRMHSRSSIIAVDSGHQLGRDLRLVEGGSRAGLHLDERAFGHLGPLGSEGQLPRRPFRSRDRRSRSEPNRGSRSQVPLRPLQSWYGRVQRLVLKEIVVGDD
jgi:hypothetical protein